MLVILQSVCVGSCSMLTTFYRYCMGAKELIFDLVFDFTLLRCNFQVFKVKNYGKVLLISVLNSFYMQACICGNKFQVCIATFIACKTMTKDKVASVLKLTYGHSIRLVLF